MADIHFNDDNLPEELRALLNELGPIEWSVTDPLTPEQHAENTLSSAKLTAEHFGQEGPQAMQFITLEGTETVVAYIGTSPNSGNIARILVGIWNSLHAAMASHEASKENG